MPKTAFSDMLREAINAAPVSRYKISQATGISQATLSHFMNGNRGLSLPSIDALCDFLNLKLVEDKAKKGK
jgi:transcriptional regulator with XRE-family HTH domain